MEARMSQVIAYTVAATFVDRAVAEEWIDWLRRGHIREVLASGGSDAEIVRLDGADCTIEVRYHFASRAAFSEYESKHAPRLRAEGTKRFPPDRGIVYRRSVGAVEMTLKRET
jgi:hypothetical protein